MKFAILAHGHVLVSLIETVGSYLQLIAGVLHLLMDEGRLILLSAMRKAREGLEVRVLGDDALLGFSDRLSRLRSPSLEEGCEFVSHVAGERVIGGDREKVVSCV